MADSAVRPAERGGAQAAPHGIMRQVLIASFLALALTATGVAPAAAESTNPVEQRLIANLTAQGYQILEMGYTWLGRLRIVAENGELHREIVVNPGTGEVLRDYAVLITDMSDPGLVGPEDGSGHGLASAGTTGSGTMAAATAGTGVAAASAGPPPAGREPASTTSDTLLLAPALEN